MREPSFWLPNDDIELSTRADTSFRDQAAIALMVQDIDGKLYDVITGGEDIKQSVDAFARWAFDIAEALDAERKRRDSGNG